MGITRSSFHKRRATGGKRKLYRKKRKFEMGRPAAATKLGSKRIHLVRGRGGNIKHRALRLDTGNYSWGTEAVTRKTRILSVVYNASNNELVRTNTLVKNSIIQIDATPFRQWYERHYGVALGKKKTVTKEKAAKAAKPAKGAKAAKASKPAKDAKSAKTAAAAAPAKDDKKKTETAEAAKSKQQQTLKPKKKKKTVIEQDAEAILAKKSRSVNQKIRKRARRHTVESSLDEQFTTGRLYACISSRPGQSGRCDGYILEGKELEFYLRKIHQKKKSAKS